MMNRQLSTMPGPSKRLAFCVLVVLVASQGCSRGGSSARGIIVVNAPAAGEIRRVLAREGMEVVEGQPIAEIAVYSTAQSAATSGPDQRQAPPPTNVELIKTQIEVARRDVVHHEVEVQRLTALVAAGQASQADLDAARALYERAQQRLQSLKTAAQQAQSTLVAERQQSVNSSTATPSPPEQIVTARASVAGIVSALNTRIGERVVAGQPLATIRSR